MTKAEMRVSREKLGLALRRLDYLRQIIAGEKELSPKQQLAMLEDVASNIKMAMRNMGTEPEDQG